MTSKRKLEEVSNDVVQSLKIKIVAKEVAKNKNYLFPPKSLNIVPTTSNKDSDSWFSFSKEFYPLAFFDADDKVVVDEKRTMTYGVFSNEKNAVPFEAKAKPLKHGIYWFNVVKAHAGEQLSLRFSSDGVDDLFFEIEVVHSAKSSKSENSDACVNKMSMTSSKTSPSIKEARKRVSARFVAAASPTVEAEDEVSLQESQQQVEAAPSSVEETSEVQNAIEVDQLVAECENVTGFTNSTSGNFVDSILAMPPLITLDNKTRLEQPLVGATGVVVESVVIKGPLFEVRLPLALVRAVLDDKATNATRVVEYLAEVAALSVSGGSAASGKSVQLPLNLRKPSVGELFQRLHDKALTVLGAANGHVEGCVDTLRHLFEYFLEDHLLYPSERQAFRARINLLRSTRSAFAEEFGAYHFLRLLVLVISGAEIVGAANPSETSSVSKSGRSDSSINSITNYFTVATGAAKGGTQRQSRNAHSKMQEVLDLAISLLNEDAQLLFY